MLNLLLVWLVTTISFLIVSRLPIGIEIDILARRRFLRRFSAYLMQSCDQFWLF